VYAHRKNQAGWGGVFSDFSSHFQSISSQLQLMKRVEKIQEKNPCTDIFLSCPFEVWLDRLNKKDHNGYIRSFLALFSAMF
jgi:hypothetical protein